MLRDYQIKAVDAIWENLNRHVVASLPTGSGKSHIIAEICRRALAYEGTHILIIAHVRELLEQNAAKIQAAIPDAPVGIYCAGLKQRQLKPITVASVQSLARAKEIPAYDLILVDEAHRIPHGTSGQYHAIFDRLPRAKICGLTATPYRLDGGYIHEGEEALFEDLVYECRAGELIAQGYLSPIHAYQGTEADLTGVGTRQGDFIIDEMAERFCGGDMIGSSVRDIRLKAKDCRKIMVFCCSIKHCGMIVDEMRKQGEESVSLVTGKTHKQDREEIIHQFRDGDLRILINCDVLTTGFDAPNVDCIALLRATKSPGLYVQIVGRGLRLAPGKKSCLLLDFGGNVRRHGPIDSASARAPDPDHKPQETKTCPECKAIVDRTARSCRCGFAFTGGEPRQIKHDKVADDKADPIHHRIARYNVMDVRYRKHIKKDRPSSLKVTYVCRSGLIPTEFSEWVCLEHQGFAASKARMWFAQRGLYPSPKTVDQAITRSAEILKPHTITIKHSKFPEVISHEF